MRAGDPFGEWKLVKRLGRGGNAVVWEAERDGERGAIKLLTRRDAEAVARFEREIETMRDLSDRAGVLPLLDAEVPDASKPVPGWLVTPVAEVSFKALDGVELPEVVQAVQEIASTLAGLHADPGKAHRDLKPSNLFRWEDRWVVGDFGLVTGDDSEALTAPGRILGPINFVAYEVMTDPTTADPFRADVFSLGKTLWVLATAQRWPPGGHQPVDDLPIGRFRQHSRTELLDSIIDRATSLRPEDRPSMAEFAGDLQAWLDMDEQGGTEAFSLGDYGRELRERAAPQFEAQRQEEALGEATYLAYEALRDRLEPMMRELERNLPGVERNPNHALVVNMLQVHPGMGEPQIVTSYVESVRVVQPGQDFGVALRMGALLERLDDGVVRLNGLLFVGHEGESGADFWVPDERRARAGSIDVQAQIEALGRELEQQLPEYVRRYEAQAY